MQILLRRLAVSRGISVCLWISDNESVNKKRNAILCEVHQVVKHDVDYMKGNEMLTRVLKV